MQNLGGQTKSIMVLSEVAYFSLCPSSPLVDHKMKKVNKTKRQYPTRLGCDSCIWLVVVIRMEELYRGPEYRGPVAQLVEQRFALWEVVSSTLAGPTLRVLK